MAEGAFDFSAGPYPAGALRVAALEGHEALSRPFRFEVELVVADGEAPDGRALLDAPATLALRSPGGERLVHGVVTRARLRGVVGRRQRLSVTLEPRLARLGLVQRSRAFQGKSAPEIALEVLAAGGVATRAALSGRYPPRELCVQYRESDLAFVARLLEAEGIHYAFEHEADRHTMVLADDSTAAAALPGGAPLPFRERGAAPDVDHIFAFARTRAVQTGAVALGGFDFVRPALDLAAPAAADGDDAALEEHDHPGGHATPAEGARLARARLEQHRAGVDTAAGESTCARLLPGVTIELAEHPRAGFNERYLVAEVVHRGRDPVVAGALGEDGDGGAPSYDNRLVLVPAAVRFRPARRTPRPVIAGVQTARVVGAAGEEIHTDAHGRIKLRFHWDREAPDDDRASAWVRVGHAWAGAGWGALHLPRVGMEVVLRFLDGDPDHPLVVGCLYNGHNPPPVALPGEKTRSVLRSSSSIGGGGANELSFEDAAGGEQVLVHAQKDASIVVLADKQQTVGGHEALAVRGDRARTIGGGQMLSVVGDDAATVRGAQRLTVSGDRTTGVTGGQREVVSGGSSTTVLIARKLDVASTASETVALARALTVGGAYVVDVGAAATVAVAGARTTLVGRHLREEVGGFRREVVQGAKTAKVAVGGHATDVGKGLQRVVGKDARVEVGRCHITQAKTHAGHVAKTIAIEADELGLVVGGEVVLIVNKAGTLKLFGKEITLDAASEGAISGKKLRKQGKGKSASKRLDDALSDEEAEDLGAGSGENPLLSAADVKGFKDGAYRMRVLKKDLIAYRLHDGGPGGFPVGKWVTKGRVPPGLEGKLRCALDPTWTNAATKVARVRVPAGTRVFEGAFAPQQGAAVGQGRQLCIAVDRAKRGAEIAADLAARGIRVLP